MRKLAVVVLLVAIALCFCAAAHGAQVMPGARNVQLAQPLNAGALIRFNRADILRSINKSVTLEGFYYDGSIPMIIDNFDLVRADNLIPPDAYVPLVGARPSGIKWGDHVSVIGTLEKPLPSDPKNLQREPVVIRVKSNTDFKILRVSPVSMMRRVFDFGRIHINPALFRHYYAVLIAGGADPANNHIRYWNDLKTMYGILKAKGYNPANIIVIYADGSPVDGSMPVNYKATKANVAAAFTTLASQMGGSDDLYIMLNDHGGQGSATESVLWLWDDVQLSAAEFAADVNKIASYHKIISQMKQCFSGGYIQDMTKPNRVIMSSASAMEVSWAHGPDYQYGEFTYWYFTALTGKTPDTSTVYNADTNGDGNISIVEAYNFARSHDAQPETPFYEDNGVVPAHSGAIPNSGEGVLGAASSL